eukprot:6476462-Amphidinium_carterae.2
MALLRIAFQRVDLKRGLTHNHPYSCCLCRRPQYKRYAWLSGTAMRALVRGTQCLMPQSAGISDPNSVCRYRRPKKRKTTERHQLHRLSTAKDGEGKDTQEENESQMQQIQ